MFTGKAYRKFYDEEQKKFVVVESDINYEYDFEHAPQTNFEEELNLMNPSRQSEQESCDRLNKEIEDGVFLLVKCKDCGLYFLISQGEKEYYEVRDLSLPKRCRRCRIKRKAANKQQK